MKKNIVLMLFLCVASVSLLAQSLVDISKSISCESAIKISTTEIFGPTTAPTTINTTDNKMFANTQNIVWYKFEAAEDGYLTFSIYPIDTLDNYDFVLYKGKDICKEITSDSKIAIRSNFYRNESVNQGVTGLAIHGDKKSFSECVEVKKGDSFYLLLNNIYESGSGHSIEFEYLKPYILRGIVVDRESKIPINNAKLTWQNMRDKSETFTALTNKKGEFEMNVLIQKEIFTFPRYYFYAYTDAYFFSDTVILSKEIPTIENSRFQFELTKIKEGYNYESLPNIYFEPNESDLSTGADKILKDLLMLMELNPDITLQIDGHTNGFYPSTLVDEVLSEDRAKLIKKYLTDNGIDVKRISTRGLGSTKLIYKTPEDEIQEGFNRRVEFFILKF